MITFNCKNMLKYTLKEITRVAEQAKLVKAIKEDCQKRGIEYKQYKELVQAKFEGTYDSKETLIDPSKLKGLNSDKTVDNHELKKSLDFIFSTYSYQYSIGIFIQNDFPNSTLSVEDYKEMLAYFANTLAISKSKFIRKSSPSFSIENLPVYSIVTPVKGSSSLDYNVNISNQFTLSYLFQIANHSILTKSKAWDSFGNKGDYLSYFFHSPSSSVFQKTKNSYTNVSPNKITEDINSDTVNYTTDEFYYSSNGEPSKTGRTSSEIGLNAKEMRSYISELRKDDSVFTGSIDIIQLFNKVNNAINLTIQSSDLSKVIDRGITYKMVFDIESNKSFYADSIDLFQSLYLLIINGETEARFYFDEENNKLVILAKDTEVVREELVQSDNIFQERKKITVKSPNYSIIEGQDVSLTTNTFYVDYVEFLFSEYSLREQISLINPATNIPLMLNKEFISEYPNLVSIYNDQKVIASTSSLEDRLSYVDDVVSSYIDSYTYLSKEDGKEVRKAKPKKSWKKIDYVYKIEESYWTYNQNICVDELLAYFLSKGNKTGYRYLSLKILGLDYWLFQDVISEKLIEEGFLFVNNIFVSEKDFIARIKYSDKNDFISKNIYEKKDELESDSFLEYLKKYYGEEKGSEIEGNHLEIINEAIENRFVPTINPVPTGNQAEDEANRLNIDIHCPIFYKASYTLKDNASVDTASSTGRAAPRIRIETVTGYSSNSRVTGIKSLFMGWLTSLPSSQILGNFSVDEIKEAYVMPVDKGYYIYNWIAPYWQDKDGNSKGIDLSDVKRNNDKYTKNTLTRSRAWTRDMFYEQGLLKSPDVVTDKESENIYSQLELSFLERRWDCANEGRRLFNKFLKEALTEDSQETIDKLWNTYYNNYSKPDLLKQPVFVTHNVLFGERDNAFEFGLREAQLEGVRHVTANNNSGLLLHEVGFGKTTTSITYTNQMFNTGEGRRALFLVPTSVYDKFFTEITGDSDTHGLFPNAKVFPLGNAREKALRNLKNPFTDSEENLLSKFKEVISSVDKIINKALPKSRIMFAFENNYSSKSSYEEFVKILKSEIKALIPDYEKYTFLSDNMFELMKDSYMSIYEQTMPNYEDYSNKINASITDSEKQKYEDDREVFAEKASNQLQEELKEIVITFNIRLIDEIGSYKSEVMEDNVIFVATHKAVERLRPSIKSVQEALHYKLGLGEVKPNEEIEYNKKSEWRKVSKSGYGQAYNILQKHPVSLDKLEIDILVVDEIHNFNNIIGKVSAKSYKAGRESGKEKEKINNIDQYLYSGYGYKLYIPVQEDTQNAKGAKDKAVIKYDSSWVSANKNKLNLAALSFFIQDKNKDSRNVLMLSATPFTDHPLQVISVLGLSNKKMLTSSGINNSFDFFNNYVKESYQYGVKHNGDIGLFPTIEGYYNSKALSNLITNVSNVKITDDAIEKSRPVKAVLPQEKIDNQGDTQVTVSGKYFSELEGVSSRVGLSKIQKEMQEIILDYLRDDNETRLLSEMFPAESIKSESEISIDSEVEDYIKEKRAEINDFKKVKDFEAIQDLVAELEAALLVMYSGNKKLINLIKKTRISVLGESKEDVEEEFSTSESDVDLSAVSKDKVIQAKAITCQSVQEQLVISPYFVKVGKDGDLVYKGLPDLSPDPAKIFVENSPKLLFIVKAIQSTINYQKEQLKKGDIEKIGGQVVYFNKIKFTYKGTTYNAFELLAEYITRYVDGISDEKFEKSGEFTEVAIIAGKGVKDDSSKNKKGEITRRGKVLIKNQFNNGKVKILLGSKAIKEGIDLQGNSHTMYIAQAEFSPTVSMQLEGRIWRQKNPYDNVRIVYVLALNSIDAFVYDKLNRKINNIKRMLEAGVYDMNTTQFTMNARERLLSLITDPDLLTKIEFYQRKSELSNNVNRLDKKISELRNISEKYESLKTQISSYLPTINYLAKELSKLNVDEKKNDIEKEILKSRKPEMKKAVNKFKNELRVQFEGLSDAEGEKYKAKKDSKKPSWTLYEQEFRSDVEELKAKFNPTQGEIDAVFDELDFSNPIPSLESDINENTPYSIIEPILTEILKELSSAYKVEGGLFRMEIEEQAAEIKGIDKKSKKSFKVLKIWHDSPYVKATVNTDDSNMYEDDDKIKVYKKPSSLTGNEDSLFKFMGRTTVLILGLDDMTMVRKSERVSIYRFTQGSNKPSENSAILKGYEELVVNEGKTFNDIPDIIKSFEDSIADDKIRLSNDELFKEEIKKNWLEILSKRKEVDNLDVDDVVKSFEKSNKLIKLRK